MVTITIFRASERMVITTKCCCCGECIGVKPCIVVQESGKDMLWFCSNCVVISDFTKGKFTGFVLK